MKSKIILRKQADYCLEDIVAFVRDTVAIHSAATPLFRSGDRVLLKHNLLRASKPEQCVVTHPKVVEAVCIVLNDFGVKKIDIADSPALGSPQQVARKAGYGPFEKRYGVRLTSLTRPTAMETLEQIPHLKIAGSLNDYNQIVNLPKVKSHCQMTLTLAIKNLFGVVIGKRKPILHCLVQNDKVKFGRLIVEIARKVAPGITIVDGITAMQGNGPINGTPYPLGLLIGGSDLTAIDRLIADILQVPEEQVYALTAASQLKYGAESLEQIELMGETDLEALRVTGFELAQRKMDISFNPARIAKSFLKQFIEIAFKEKFAKDAR